MLKSTTFLVLLGLFVALSYSKPTFGLFDSDEIFDSGESYYGGNFGGPSYGGPSYGGSIYGGQSYGGPSYGGFPGFNPYYNGGRPNFYRTGFGGPIFGGFYGKKR